MQRLTGVQTVTGYARDRSEVLPMLWATICLLIRGKVAFKMSVPAGGVFVPNHAALEPCQDSSETVSGEQHG